MRFIETLSENERDAFRQFLEGPGVNALVKFIEWNVSASRNRAMNHSVTMEELHRLQGCDETMANILRFLKDSARWFDQRDADPEKEDE